MLNYNNAIFIEQKLILQLPYKSLSAFSLAKMRGKVKPYSSVNYCGFSLCHNLHPELECSGLLSVRYPFGEPAAQLFSPATNLPCKRRASHFSAPGNPPGSSAPSHKRFQTGNHVTHLKCSSESRHKTYKSGQQGKMKIFSCITTLALN